MTHLINSQSTGDQFPTSIIIAIEPGVIQQSTRHPVQWKIYDAHDTVPCNTIISTTISTLRCPDVIITAPTRPSQRKILSLKYNAVGVMIIVMGEYDNEHNNTATFAFVSWEWSTHLSASR